MRLDICGLKQLGMILIVGTAMLAAGCASYATPGRGADLTQLGVSPEMRAMGTDVSIRRAIEKQPLASLPAAVAVARVQQPGYQSMTTQSFGHGNYSVITTRDIEKTEQIARLEKLPMLRGIAPVNRLLLSQNLQSDEQLRQAAAQLHADMLLIYTLDTTFHEKDNARPLSLITLGLSPNLVVRLNTTASAVLMDTRNGYIYGVAEASESRDQLTNAWQSDVAADDARRKTEEAAFGKLVGEIETMWGRVVKEYAPDKAATIQ